MQSKPNSLRLRMGLVVFLTIALPTVPGCGGGKVKKVTGKVDGTVTFSGQPVKGGTVYFESKSGGDGGSAPLNAGHFKVAEPLPVGSYVVIVMPIVLTPDEVADGKKPPPSDDIPEKYRSAQTSDQTFEVKEGQNTFEVKMTPP